MKRGIREAFTILELLVVVAIIAILASLVLSIAGFVQNKVARSRTESEHTAIETALESYHTEFGEYPNSGTNSPDPDSPVVPSAQAAGTVLYGYICSNSATGNAYFNPSSSMTGTNTNGATPLYLMDAFGNPYAYRCPGKYNTATYDLWSSGGATFTSTSNSDKAKWIANFSPKLTNTP